MNLHDIRPKLPTEPGPGVRIRLNDQWEEFGGITGTIVERNFDLWKIETDEEVYAADQVFAFATEFEIIG